MFISFQKVTNIIFHNFKIWAIAPRHSPTIRLLEQIHATANLLTMHIVMKSLKFSSDLGESSFFVIHVGFYILLKSIQLVDDFS